MLYLGLDRGPRQAVRTVIDAPDRPSPALVDVAAQLADG